MSLLDLFKGKRKPPLEILHPDFGKLTYSRHDGWMKEDFELWGFHPVELQVAGDEQGPSDEQVAAFTAFQGSRETLLPRCLDAVRSLRSDLEGDLTFRVSGLTIPSLDASERAGTLWTLWLDLVDDDHYLYGVQTNDGWRTLLPFMDD